MKFIITVWLICGFITYGTTFAYFQSKYPLVAEEQYREDIGDSIFFSLFGPFGLIVSSLLSGFWEYGWKLK